MAYPDLSAPTTSCSYTGEPGPLTSIMLKNGFYGLFSLHIYNLWGQARQRRYIWSNIYVGDDPLEWLGDNISQRLSASTLARAIVGFFLATRALHMLLGLVLQDVSYSVFAMELMCGIILGSVASYHSAQYQARNTRFRAYTFEIRGDAKIYGLIYLRGLVWALATLGLGYGYFAVSTRRYLIDGLQWGGLQGKYTGTEAEARKLYVFGGLATVLSLGAYLPWHIAKLRRYHGEHTTLGPLRLQVHQEGSTLSNLWVLNFAGQACAEVCGVGFASTRALKYQMEHLRIEGLTNAVMPLTPPSTTDDLGAEQSPQEGLVDALGPGPLTIFGA